MSDTLPRLPEKSDDECLRWTVASEFISYVSIQCNDSQLYKYYVVSCLENDYVIMPVKDISRILCLLDRASSW